MSQVESSKEESADREIEARESRDREIEARESRDREIEARESRDLEIEARESRDLESANPSKEESADRESRDLESADRKSVNPKGKNPIKDDVPQEEISEEEITDDQYGLIQQLLAHVINALEVNPIHNTPPVGVTILHHLLKQRIPELKFRIISGYLNIWGPVEDPEAPYVLNFFSKDLLEADRVKTTQHWWLDCQGTVFDPFVVLLTEESGFEKYRISYTRRPVGKLEVELPTGLEEVLMEIEPGEIIPLGVFGEELASFMDEVINSVDVET